MASLTPLAKAGHEVLFYVGAGGLLTVMLVEAIAVVGRHSGIPVLGALEVAQAAIVPAACASMVIASLQGSHATVSLVLDRLRPTRRAFFARFCALLSSLFLAVLFVGACWLAHDFWNSHEHSEVLQIPFRPLRILTAVTAGALALIFLRTRVRPGHEP